MDIELEKGINEAMTSLRELSVGNIDFAKMDPVAKMMLITLVSETKKIQDIENKQKNADINSVLSVIALNVNGLETSTKTKKSVE